MAIDAKAIRRAMMVAKDIAASVSNVPLMRSAGGRDNPAHITDFIKSANYERNRIQQFQNDKIPEIRSVDDVMYADPLIKQSAMSALKPHLVRKTLPMLQSLAEQHGLELTPADRQGHYWDLEDTDSGDNASVRWMKDHSQTLGGGWNPHFGERSGESDIDVHYDNDGNINVQSSRLALNHPKLLSIAKKLHANLHGKNVMDVLSQSNTPLMKAKGGAIDQDLKIANLIGADTSSIPEIRKAGELNKFRQSMQEDVQSRAQRMANLGQKYHESGLLPHPVGTVLQTPSSRQKNLPPMKVMGHYVDSKNPDRYGYFVNQGDTNGMAMVSDPVADERIRKTNPSWDRQEYWNQTKPLRGPQGFAKAKGGQVDTIQEPERQQNLDRFMEDSHPSIPKVLYHGTTAIEDFPSFSDEDAPDRGGLLAFFSEHPEFASAYAEHPHPERKHGRVIPVHVNIQNPFDFRKHADLAHEFYEETGGITDPWEIQRITNNSSKKLSADDFKFHVERGDWPAIEAPKFVRWLRNRGHDGVIMREHMTRGAVGSKDRKRISALNYGIFEPTQVKSAVGNVGTFDPENPDITKAYGGDVEANDQEQWPHPVPKENMLKTHHAQRYGTGLPNNIVPENMFDRDENPGISHGTGPYLYALEHIGDLPHRLSYIDDVGGGVGYGIEAALDKTARNYDLRPERLNESLQRNYNFQKRENSFHGSYDDFVKKFEDAADRYAHAYRMIPVHTQLQELGRDAAIALGERDFYTARKNLNEIHRRLSGDNPEQEYWRPVKDLEASNSIAKNTARLERMRKAGGGDVEPANMGINVRSDNKAGIRYADEIVDGNKKYETRDSDSLRPYVGKRVAIVRTGEGPARAIGEVTVGEPIVADHETFHKLRPHHLVPAGSTFDIKPGGQKYLYPMHDPVRFDADKDVGAGIVSRKIITKADGGDVEGNDAETDDDYLTVYHGTPHRFAPTERSELGEFDPTKIGTGAGNQSYGHGLYLSQNPDLAKTYRKNLGVSHGKWFDKTGKELSFSNLTRDQKLALRHLQLNGGDVQKAESDIKMWEDATNQKNITSALHSLTKKDLSFEPATGALYTVGLRKKAADRMLDWHAPFSQQHPDVQKALQDAGIVGKDDWLVSGMRGDEIYRRAQRGAPLQLPLRAIDDHKFAAKRLLEAGIPGIKYWDNTSWHDEGGAKHNFVVFPGAEHHLKIMKREKRGGLVTNDTQVPLLDPAKTVRRATMIAKGVGGPLTQSPSLAQTFALENRPSAIVSPRPGKGGGPPIIPEAGAQYDPALEQDREPWSFATPDIIGAAKPPPVQHPVFNQPRMRNLANATSKIFKTKGFNDLVEGMTGLRNLTVMPTVGTWKNELEPSFIIQHPDMTPEHAEKIAHLLGFGFQQDAAVHTTHNPNTFTGIPAALIGNGKRLPQEKIDELNRLAGKHGLDFTVTGDGKAAKFLHFGDEGVDYDNFLDKVNEISKSANLPEKYHARTNGDLINAKGYLNGIFGTSGDGEGIPAGAQRSPDLFRGIVDHVLAPYAKAVAGEGYRLSPERLKEAYGLTDEETDHVRNALYPTRKGDRTTIPLMTGEETLDVQPTGSKGKATVGDVLYALQNRAAAQGQIEPGDYSPKAMGTIAKHIADEVDYHVKNSPKSAVGWYDKALKAAMQQYAQIFPEITSDPDKELLFHSILGITSQGNDVFSNSTHAARIYNLVRNGTPLPDAVKQLRGSFGDKTRQIEQNLLKLHHLVDTNGYDKMRDVFNRKMTVSEWNKLLNKDETLYGPDGKPLKVDGGKDQKVTGWSVFGPKIGSFINNLHGDYSTLTADLWFSRTWNRLLGYNFVHTPLAEAKQYRDFRDALKAEYYNSNPNVGVSPSYKTENGKIVRDSKGNPAQWEYGVDAPQLSKEDFDRVINDPDEMLKLAQGLEEKYRKSGYREKSDLRRRAKNWIENRELPEALPRSDLERNFQQNTVEKAQKLLKQKYGMDISIADIQAALWFHEKELFGKLGVASEKAAPADYADAAAKTVDAFKNNSLYTVKSRMPAALKPEVPVTKEAGGAVDRALRVAHQAAALVGMMPKYGRR